MLGTHELVPTNRSVSLLVPSWPWAAPPQSLLGSLRPCDTPVLLASHHPAGQCRHKTRLARALTQLKGKVSYGSHLCLLLPTPDLGVHLPPKGSTYLPDPFLPTLYIVA